MDEAKSKAAGKKAARRAAPRKAAAHSRPAKAGRPETWNGGVSTTHPPVSPEERHRMIAETAYYRASKREFSGEAQLEDWLSAEAEVDTLLLGR